MIATVTFLSGTSNAIRHSLLFIGFLVLLLCSPHSTLTSYGQAREIRAADLTLEICVPDPPRCFPLDVRNGGRTMTLMRRKMLNVIDPDAVGDFTAIDIWAEGRGDEVEVRLSIIYNDLSNQEWWKDKKEKILGSFRVKVGESVHPAALAEYGIAPFEMKAGFPEPVLRQAPQPTDELRIENNTTALEVVQVEKSADEYHITIRNKSTRNVVAYGLSVGDSPGFVSHRGFLRTDHPVIASGEMLPVVQIHKVKAESRRMAIRVVIFDDDSFEGDEELAAKFFAKSDGMRLQAPSVLRMIDRTLKVGDTELEAAFLKLEADLWVIPEALDKQSALELLQSKFPSFDQKTVSLLYEDLKAGLYELRNLALLQMGGMKPQIQDSRQDAAANKIVLDARSIRDALIRIRSSVDAFSEKR